MKGIEERVGGYLPDRGLIEKYPIGPLEEDERERYERENPGANYVMTYARNELGRKRKSLIVSPPHGRLNQKAGQNMGRDYGQAVFEGTKYVPTLDDNGEIVGASLVLFWYRMFERLGWSMESQGFGWPVSKERMAVAAHDLAAILGRDVLKDKNGVPSPAYVRPELHRAGSRISVSGAEMFGGDASILICNMPHYKKPKPEGLTMAAFLDVQRVKTLTKKGPDNYSEADKNGKRAAAVGADDVMCFGPYVEGVGGGREYVNAMAGEVVMDILWGKGQLVDLQSADIVAFTRGGEMVFPYPNTGILDGATARYVRRHLARSLKLPVRLGPISLDRIRNKEIKSLVALGNAYGLMEIGFLKVCDHLGQVVEEFRFEVGGLGLTVKRRFDDELAGRIAPSHSSLLTPVDLEGGKRAREIVDCRFEGYR